MIAEILIMLIYVSNILASVFQVDYLLDYLALILL